MRGALRITLALLVLAAGAPASAAAGAPPPAPRAQEAAAVRLIRRRHAAINRGRRGYRQVRKELSGFSTEGGELVAYFDGGAVAKLVADYYGETGRATEEYYFWGGELIFVFRRDFDYSRPLSGRVVRTRENRFYFDGGRLVRWVGERGRRVAPRAAAFAGKQGEYLQSAARFVEAARSSAPTVEAAPRP